MLRTRRSAQARPAGPHRPRRRLPVRATLTVGRQPCASAVSTMYFSTAPMVTAPKPSLSVQSPSHRRSCGHRGRTSPAADWFHGTLGRFDGGLPPGFSGWGCSCAPALGFAVRIPQSRQRPAGARLRAPEAAEFVPVAAVVGERFSAASRAAGRTGRRVSCSWRQARQACGRRVNRVQATVAASRVLRFRSRVHAITPPSSIRWPAPRGWRPWASPARTCRCSGCRRCVRSTCCQ